MVFLGSDHVMISTCSVITTNSNNHARYLMHTIAAAAILTIRAISFAAAVSFALKILVTTVAVPPPIILNHSCVAMAL